MSYHQHFSPSGRSGAPPPNGGAGYNNPHQQHQPPRNQAPFFDNSQHGPPPAMTWGYNQQQLPYSHPHPYNSSNYPTQGFLNSGQNNNTNNNSSSILSLVTGLLLGSQQQQQQQQQFYPGGGGFYQQMIGPQGYYDPHNNNPQQGIGGGYQRPILPNSNNDDENNNSAVEATNYFSSPSKAPQMQGNPNGPLGLRYDNPDGSPLVSQRLFPNNEESPSYNGPKKNAGDNNINKLSFTTTNQASFLRASRDYSDMTSSEIILKNLFTRGKTGHISRLKIALGFPGCYCLFIGLTMLLGLHPLFDLTVFSFHSDLFASVNNSLLTNFIACLLILLGCFCLIAVSEVTNAPAISSLFVIIGIILVLFVNSSETVLRAEEDMQHKRFKNQLERDSVFHEYQSQTTGIRKRSRNKNSNNMKKNYRRRAGGFDDPITHDKMKTANGDIFEQDVESSDYYDFSSDNKNSSSGIIWNFLCYFLKWKTIQAFGFMLSGLVGLVSYAGALVDV